MRDVRELGRAHWREVTRVREEHYLCVCARWVRPGGLGSLHGGGGRTHESPIQSWNLMCPSVVSASKSGATLPRRRVVVEDIGAGP